MNTLEITSVSTKGQVIIPAGLRRELGLHPGSKLMVFSDGKNLLMRPVQPPKKETFDNLIKKSRKLVLSAEMKQEDIETIIDQVKNESCH